jgi:hypothetical protein
MKASRIGHGRLQRARQNTSSTFSCEKRARKISAQNDFKNLERRGKES